MTEDILNVDILKAMMGFCEDVSKSISQMEGKMDTRFQEMAIEINKSEEKSDKRMNRKDGRLDKLESEMRRFHYGKIKTNTLKQTEQFLMDQLAGIIEPPPRVQRPRTREQEREKVDEDTDGIDWFTQSGGFKSTCSRTLDNELVSSTETYNAKQRREDDRREKENMRRRKEERESLKEKELEKRKLMEDGGKTDGK